MYVESILIKDKEQLIPFVNLINEICETCLIQDEYISDWMTTHHNFLDKTPLEEFNENGMDRILDLLS